MTREKAIKILNTVLFFGKCDCLREEIEECLKMAIEALKRTSWVPITYRDMTEEEHEDVLDGVEKVFTCELPADGEEVLVTLYEGKTVTTDTFWEEYGGGYFETYAEDVTAWRKLPEPYKTKQEGKA